MGFWSRAASWALERDPSPSERASSPLSSPGRLRLLMSSSSTLPQRLATVASRPPARRTRSSDHSPPREETERRAFCRARLRPTTERASLLPHNTHYELVGLAGTSSA